MLTFSEHYGVMHIRQLGTVSYYIVIKDDGRIGDARVAILPIDSEGDTSAFLGIDCIGSSASNPTANMALKANYTFFSLHPALVPGKLFSVEINVHTAGSIKVMIFRKNATTPTNYDTIYSSGLLPVTTGRSVLKAGINFDDNVNLLVGDFIGLYSDATLRMYNTYGLFDGMEIAGDMTGQTNKTYTKSSVNYVPGIKANILTTPSNAYSAASLKIYAQPDYSYIYTNEVGVKSLFNIGNIPPGTDIGRIVGFKASYNAYQSGDGVKGADIIVKTNNTEHLIDAGSLPLTPKGQEKIFELNPATSLPWSISDINNLQIGIVSKDVTP